MPPLITDGKAPKHPRSHKPKPIEKIRATDGIQPDRRNSADWLIGGGNLGNLIRSNDWSNTPLGPRSQWPQSLRTVVNLIVGSKFPMALLWGSELLLLYNDGYRIIAGEKHPQALGHSTREIWSEVWEFNKPIFSAVMNRRRNDPPGEPALPHLPPWLYGGCLLHPFLQSHPYREWNGRWHAGHAAGDDPSMRRRP